MSGSYSESTEGIDVRYVAHLARLKLTDAEAEEFQGQLEQILGYVKQLDDLDTEGVEPMAHPIPRQNVFREDVVRDPLDRAEVTANFPAEANHLVLVPNILD